MRAVARARVRDEGYGMVASVVYMTMLSNNCCFHVLTRVAVSGVNMSVKSLLTL